MTLAADPLAHLLGHIFELGIVPSAHPVARRKTDTPPV